MSRSAATGRRARWPARAAVLLAAAGALAGDHPPREYLDEQTGATITVVSEPLVFAFPRQYSAAHAYDYATAAAAAVNRGGKIDYVLLVYFWSTVDPRLRGTAQPAAEPLVLQADDRRIMLRLRGHSALEAGIGEPVHAPAGHDATPNVYGTDLATVRFLAAARRLVLLADSETVQLTYELWDDRRAALREFVRHMSGEE